MTEQNISDKLEALLRRTTASLLKTEKRLEAERAARNEPIAIISMACRLPQGIASPEAYWELLAHGGDAIGPFPERWQAYDLYDPDQDAAGKCYAREGGFLRDVEQFDAPFFGILPREARSMDPQQRLILQTAWEALERANIVPRELLGSATGVYLGCTGSDYLSSENLSALDGYAVTGNSLSVLAGRVSYILGLHGPSLTVDTACSSSLVALHLACNALRNRECDLALSGGVTLLIAPYLFVEFSRLRGLARDGRCKSFSAQADGTGWSEACGVLVLKRLSDALRDGDRVLATVRGTAVNHDGRSQGLTAPTGPAQQRVIRDALSASRLTPNDLDAIEAHGTGTPLGDPIEAGALATVFGPTRAPEHPLWIGSSKSNLGHSVAAAGVMGVMKMVLAFQHEKLPMTLHAAERSPHISWEGSGLALLQEARAWPRGARVRRAGVSSFGIGGTNAHLVLEEAPQQAANLDHSARPTGARRALPLLLSARSERSLRSLAQRWLAWCERTPESALPDLVYGAARKRTRFEFAAAAVGEDLSEIGEALRALAEGRPHPALQTARAAPCGKLAVLFTGQGSQRAGMGGELYARYETIREALDEVAEAMAPYLALPLQSVLFATPGSPDALLLDRTEYAQPALFALEVALYRQWQSWGVRPSFVAGHSIGELSAAHVAGVWTLADAAKLVCARGRLMQACRPDGAMMSLEASENEVLRVLADGVGGVDIAGVNAPHQTVVSGDADAIERLAQRFSEQGRATRRLRVSHAFHSAHMDSMLARYREVVESCTPREPELAVVSLLTGRAVSPGELTATEYWVRQVREPVRFVAGIQSLVANGARTFLECGPEGVLTALVRDCAESEVVGIASLRKGKGEPQSLASALAALDFAGQELDWSNVIATPTDAAIDLPTYAFDTEAYWVERSNAGEPRAQRDALDSTLLEALSAANGERVAELLDLPQAERALLDGLFPFLSDWRGRAKRASEILPCLYRHAWRRVDDGSEAHGARELPSLAGAWLLVAPGSAAEPYAFVTRLIAERGGRVISLCSEALADEEALRQVDVAALRGVIALTPLDTSAHTQHVELPGGLFATLALLRRIDDARSDVPLWILTQGSIQTHAHERPADPRQALVVGLNRVVSLEQPQRAVALVDLPPALDETTEQQLARLLAGAQAEREIALRPEGQFASRLDRLAAPTGSAFRARDTVLVTGGSGALAAHLARWLGDRGARHIVLASRRGIDAPASAPLKAELENRGLRVSIVACDVSKRAPLAALLAELTANEESPLSAVFHAAGVLEDGLLSNLDDESVARVVQAKLTSAQLLDELTRPMPLDAFVLFSSLSGLLGNPGQANYASANAALDALATQRRAAGLPAISIAWGPWRTGMVSEDVAAFVERNGMRPFEVQRGLSCLERALTAADSTVAVADFDWPRLVSRVASTRAWPLLFELAEARAAHAESSTVEQAALGWLRDAPPAERPKLLLQRLTRWTEDVTKQTNVDPEKNFLELGFDSLTVMELVNHIRALTSVVVYPREVVQTPTLAALSAYVAEQFSGGQTAQAKPSDGLAALRRTFRRHPPEQRVPTVAFILSAPRSGSTLLRAMLAGHPRLFSPPELHLLAFDSMAGWSRELSGSYLDEGLVRALMELKRFDAAEAQRYVADLTARDASVADVYRDVIELCGPRLLVDKSPTYAFQREILAQAEQLFHAPRYIHLVRHPYAVIDSFKRMRMNELVGVGVDDPYEAGELVWTKSNQNTLLLGEDVAREGRYLRVVYEDLVRNPQRELEVISNFLGVQFEPEMLTPYGEGRMTDGVHAKSLPIGDQNFLKHKRVESELADAWRSIRLPRSLGDEALALCRTLGYETPNEPARRAVSLLRPAEGTRSEQTIEVGGQPLCVSTWGASDREVVLCLHGHGDQGPIWEDVARHLTARGTQVIAPDLRGYGLSPLASPGESTHLFDFVADLDGLCGRLSIERARVLAHSLGSVVAVAFAALFPQRVASLCLVEPILPEASTGRIAQRLSRRIALRGAKPVRHAFRDEAAALAAFARVHPTLDADCRDRLARRLLLQTPDGPCFRSEVSPFSVSEWISRDDYLTLLGELDLPCTIAFGTESTRVRPEDISEVRRALSGASELSLRGTHNVHYEQASAIADATLYPGARSAAE